jgi:hypothetical protein
MFTTYLLNEAPSLVNPDRIRHWWSVHLWSQSCWFFCAPASKRQKNLKPCFLTSPDAVVALTAQEGWVQGLDVTVATPPHMNRSLHWRFHKLAAVWLCKEPDDSQWAFILQTQEGDEYALSSLETPARFLRKLEQVRIFKRPRSATAQTRRLL